MTIKTIGPSIGPIKKTRRNGIMDINVADIMKYPNAVMTANLVPKRIYEARILGDNKEYLIPDIKAMKPLDISSKIGASSAIVASR
mmetsp:Transcript_19384/g.28516  ORF Transcript_19384/g.28516 Transcript_19384/m.28516 type:complete len:86 (+) Transcript_19384:779-1036(+)